jgi:ferredoxin
VSVHLPVVRTLEPPVTGERTFARLEKIFVALDRVLPERVNPFARSGAVACVAIIVAVATGIPLLFWYTASVHGAYASLERMSFVPQLVRSLHRYASDLAMIFGLLHGVRLLVARRFGGPRRLAWVTGLFAIGALWLVGWLGYWLVWDQRARQVATGSGRVLDVLPIFAEPFSRTLLTDASVKPLLFFIVFFLHMLIPLGLGIALWLHLARLARPRYLTNRALSIGIGVLLVGISLVVPARSAAPAQMAVVPARLTIDWLYLWPIWATARLSGGALWACSTLIGVVSIAVPWILARRRAPAAIVDSLRCNACGVCIRDCPYDAITLEPRTDDRPFPGQAVINPARCVGCGVCVGSCDPGGIRTPQLPLADVRATLDRWLDHEPRAVVFTCARSAKLEIDPETGACEAHPGKAVLAVPCVGWVHPLLVERALRHGAPEVIVAGCPPGDPAYREGAEWTRARLAGERIPKLRHGDHVRYIDGAPRRRPWGAALALAATGIAVALLSDLSCGIEPDQRPALIVSFKVAGAPGGCRPATDADNAGRPAYMRQQTICQRGRSPVHLRVTVDSAVVVDRPYAARGLYHDGASIAVERIPVSAGAHDVSVEVGDSSEARRLDFARGMLDVVLFDRASGFTWTS